VQETDFHDRSQVVRCAGKKGNKVSKEAASLIRDRRRTEDSRTGLQRRFERCRVFKPEVCNDSEGLCGCREEDCLSEKRNLRGGKGEKERDVLQTSGCPEQGGGSKGLNKR